MKKYTQSMVFLLFILTVFYSCSDPQQSVPYLVSVPEVKINENPGVYRFCGIEFNFYNTSQKEITRIDVTCYAYSTIDKKNVLTGSNKIEARFNDAILPYGTKRFAISLDSRLSLIPVQPFMVDFFTIPLIQFSDGTTWTDPVCQFYTRSN